MQAKTKKKARIVNEQTPNYYNFCEYCSKVHESLFILNLLDTAIYHVQLFNVFIC